MPKYEVAVTAVSDRTWFDLRKALQMVAGLGWLEARRLSRYVLAVDRNTEQYLHLPCVLVAGIDRATADHVAALLREAGTTVSVEESTARQPMLLCPKANQRYTWDDVLAMPVVDPALYWKRRLARRIAWTAAWWAWITAILVEFGVEKAPAGGTEQAWGTGWLLPAALLGAVYGAFRGLLKGIGRLGEWAENILIGSWALALIFLVATKPNSGQGYSVEDNVGWTLCGAIYGAILGAVLSFAVWFLRWLLRRIYLALLHLFRGGRTA
jgi:hypothetical protein